MHVDMNDVGAVCSVAEKIVLYVTTVSTCPICNNSKVGFLEITADICPYYNSSSGTCPLCNKSRHLSFIRQQQALVLNVTIAATNPLWHNREY